ncbi:hypothetical protein KUTeg_006552 [Tegillarca granosa]|uniref:Uncharacterized protein n=1 Tax=Tegillarca granosa TaxID=220873 RepID=A0ABQ9FEZ2_TEGGR|nr:hypothetical protein KUTeg_006552 [Tegillarca granosa]
MKYLVALLEQNFDFNIKKFQHGQLNVHKLKSTMLSQLLWPGMNQICLNGRCHDLLSLFEDCLACQMDEQRKIEVAKLLLSLLCMAVELCSCTEFGSQEVSGVKLIQGEKVSPFLDQISKKIYASKLDRFILRQVLAGLQPSWISLGVCCCLLNEQDDYLILEGLPSGALSLPEIVSKYFFLLPKFSNNSKYFPAYKSPHEKWKSARQSMANILNKRNIKGETPLHTACIKNNVVQLQQLLNIPGVDINVKDNAGWTPLHEACNHGEVNKSRKVDLLASTDDGITPLHDAVMNDRQDVCQLLLQHGGSKLLESKTIDNLTPMDLAYTDSMRSLLGSYESDNVYRFSSSQESGSQSSQETTCPSDFRYQQIVGLGNSQQFIDKEECRIYIYIATQLVSSYLHTTNIQAVAHKLQNSQSKLQHNVCMKHHSSKNVLSISDEKSKSKTVLSNSNESRIEICENSESLTLSVSEFEDSKIDLKILKKWPKYVQRFENHLLRITHPKDHNVIRSDLLFIRCVAG